MSSVWPRRAEPLWYPCLLTIRQVTLARSPQRRKGSLWMSRKLNCRLCIIHNLIGDSLPSHNHHGKRRRFHALATAEDLTGAFPTGIVGTLDGVDQNDVNMFKISNLDPTNFSALTELPGAFGIPDTVLSLFNASGVGVFLNDDISGSNTLSCLPSAGAGNPCPTSGVVLPAGTYYLAISRSANYPVDSFGNEIFQPRFLHGFGWTLLHQPCGGLGRRRFHIT